MPVTIKTPAEVEKMRVAGKLAAEVLEMIGEYVKPGVSTDELDRICHDHIVKVQQAIPANLGYRGFPKTICTSVNHVICHGIPDARKILKDGDIINIDVTHIYKGYHGDTSATFYVGQPSEEAKLVTEVARKCLEIGIAEVRPGARLGDIGAGIQEFAEARGCSVVRDFVGHGIGRIFHDEPKVNHYGFRGRGKRLQAGMTFTIEPMINLGTWEVKILADEWTAVTADGRLSAQFEHTVLVTDEGAEILTARDRPLKNSEVFGDFWDKSRT